jgi:heat shock protein 90kDa beta
VEVPDETAESSTSAAETTSDATPSESPASSTDDEEIVVEDVPTDEALTEKTVKMKSVVVDEWKQLNAQPPIWTRDPKNVTDGLFLDRTKYLN